MEYNQHVIFWNVRGLNCPAKRSAVHSVMASTNPCIMCLQETKISALSSPLVRETLGAQFADYFFLPATDTRGGILLAWKNDIVSLSHPTIADHFINALVSPRDGSPHWWVTGVYGPQQDQDKTIFLSDLHDMRSCCADQWLIGGDFNMIATAEDKNNGNLHRASMHRFRHITADEELRDLYLHGRRYTWSNEREAPTLERIDRMLCTAGWASDHPSYMLRRLSSTASDHAPLFIDALPRSSKHMRFHFERFWPSLPGYHDTVAQAWSSVPHEPDPFRCIFAKLRATASERATSIDFDALDPRSFELHDLELPFSEGEIWDAIRQLLKGRAPGPDKFTSEFLCASWPIIKEDFVAAFEKLSALNGRGFQRLNEALLLLLPKRQDACTLSDYRPISLIHLFAKLFAKVLSLCLAPSLGEMISTNQSVFIARHCIHDNFMLV
ncbi:uncharacterized protein [Aegilops tauschii subsp. strangulata]|uniref:uncharacterized protein n=1 Tax=Aegilops tauschii subsp. strangulata TaxID=200361 RepID=UPI003CC8A8C2